MTEIKSYLNHTHTNTLKYKYFFSVGAVFCCHYKVTTYFLHVITFYFDEVFVVPLFVQLPECTSFGKQNVLNG